MYSRHSLTALGLPGRLMIRVRPRVPATPRESMPKGVCCRLMARIASAIPGASRSRTAFVASGVTSRGADVFATGVLARAFRAAIADGQYSDGYHTTPWLPIRALWLRSGGVLQRARRYIRRACPLPLPGIASLRPVCARYGAAARAQLHRGCAC